MVQEVVPDLISLISINNSMNTKMKKYITPELSTMEIEVESVLCQSLVEDLGAGFDKWNEEKMPWDE